MKTKIRVQKKIGPFQKAGKWIKAHQKTIYISATTLGLLLFAYQRWRLHQQQNQTLDMRIQTHKLKTEAEQANISLDKKLQMARDPAFKKWLEEKHGIRLT